MRSVVHERLAMGGMALFRKRAQNRRVDLISSEIGPVTGFGGATHPARERPEEELLHGRGHHRPHCLQVLMRAARKLMAISSAPVLGLVVVTQLNSLIHIPVTRQAITLLHSSCAGGRGRPCTRALGHYRCRCRHGVMMGPMSRLMHANVGARASACARTAQ